MNSIIGNITDSFEHFKDLSAEKMTELQKFADDHGFSLADIQSKLNAENGKKVVELVQGGKWNELKGMIADLKAQK